MANPPMVIDVNRYQLDLSVSMYRKMEERVLRTYAQLFLFSLAPCIAKEDVDKWRQSIIAVGRQHDQ